MSQTEPIIAWRCWGIGAGRLGNTSDDVRLLSVGIGPHAWTAGRQDAFCARNPGGPGVSQMDITHPSKPAPFASCSCGIWAMKDLVELEAALISYDSFAYGKVSLWGKLIEHEIGYRAQYACPYQIYLSPTLYQLTRKYPFHLEGTMICWDHDQEKSIDGALAATAKAMVAFYGCEVEVTDEPFGERIALIAHEYQRQKRSHVPARTVYTYTWSTGSTSNPPTTTTGGLQQFVATNTFGSSMASQHANQMAVYNQLLSQIPSASSRPNVATPPNLANMVSAQAYLDKQPKRHEKLEAIAMAVWAIAAAIILGAAAAFLFSVLNGVINQLSR